MHNKSSIHKFYFLSDMGSSYDDGYNDSEQVNELATVNKPEGFDNIFGVSDLDIEKAIQEIEGCIPLNYEVMALETVDPIQANNYVGIHPRSSVTKSILDGTYLLPKQSHKGTQMPSPEHVRTKRADMARCVHKKNSKNLLRLGSQSYEKTNEAIMADHRTCHSKNRLLSRAVSQKSGMTSIPIVQRNTRRTLTREMPTPTLLRTALVGTQPCLKDHLGQVAKHQPCSSSWRRNRESTQRSESHQMINLPTLLEETRQRKNVIPELVSHHQRRSWTRDRSRNAHTCSTSGDEHLTSKRRAKARASPISTAHSSSASYSSLEPGSTNSSNSEDVASDLSDSFSVPSMSLARESSMKPSRRTSHSSSSMIRPPSLLHHKVPTAHTKNPEKKTGKLHRFKNKLGLIFHHHHHHHHHHHKNGAKSEVALTALTNHNPSVWSKFGKMLHRTKKGGQGKNMRTCQRQAEHGVINGLIRHIRRSKKSKRPGDTKIHSHNKKKVKKWRWWQEFRKRRVARQASGRKQYVRLGSNAKKQPPSRALTVK